MACSSPGEIQKICYFIQVRGLEYWKRCLVSRVGVGVANEDQFILRLVPSRSISNLIAEGKTNLKDSSIFEAVQQCYKCPETTHNSVKQ